MPCSGRLERADTTCDAKHSVLLPEMIYFTELVIFYFDSRVIQIGKKKTSNSCRSEFWISQGKLTIRGVIPKIVYLLPKERLTKLFVFIFRF